MCVSSVAILAQRYPWRFSMVVVARLANRPYINPSGGGYGRASDRSIMEDEFGDQLGLVQAPRTGGAARERPEPDAVVVGPDGISLREGATVDDRTFDGHSTVELTTVHAPP